MDSHALANSIKGVRVASHLCTTHHHDTTHAWTLDALSGRFIELSGRATTSALSTTARLILHAQQHNQPCAWIANQQSTFFPPDFADAGIDLHALPVMHLPDPLSAARASDILLRSGALALLVLDLGSHHELPVACQTRLAGLARHHHAAVLCLTRVNRRSSLSSLVSLRMESQKQRRRFNTFESSLTATKDKQSRPGWQHEDLLNGPHGLC